MKKQHPQSYRLLFIYRVFLLIQLISVISFIQWLNECYQSQKDTERWLVSLIHTVYYFFLSIYTNQAKNLYVYSHVHVMLLATTSYTVCIVGVILMYIWYAPDSSCLLNIFFITWTLFLIQLMTSIALHPKVSLFCFLSIIIHSCLCLCVFGCLKFIKVCLWFSITNR